MLIYRFDKNNNNHIIENSIINNNELTDKLIKKIITSKSGKDYWCLICFCNSYINYENLLKIVDSIKELYNSVNIRIHDCNELRENIDIYSYCYYILKNNNSIFYDNIACFILKGYTDIIFRIKKNLSNESISKNIFNIGFYRYDNLIIRTNFTRYIRVDKFHKTNISDNLLSMLLNEKNDNIIFKFRWCYINLKLSTIKNKLLQNNNIEMQECFTKDNYRIFYLINTAQTQ